MWDSAPQPAVSDRRGSVHDYQAFVHTQTATQARYLQGYVRGYLRGYLYLYQKDRLGGCLCQHGHALGQLRQMQTRPLCLAAVDGCLQMAH